ncbi:MAG: endonuclease/exonuclease/phosphatase family protein [Parvibaculum sp.]|nr:endonuclease/exonuclease/phosphatase family protein [Parvibaculum sp.]
MRIVSWNCNGAFGKKFHLVESLGADIAVIQECGDPSYSPAPYSTWARNSLWTGNNKHKGLGIFARPEIRMERLDWDSNSLELFLPCRINDDFNLLGVWTKQANSPNFAYIGQFWKYLQAYKEKLSAGKAIVCGDFNSNKRWDEWDRWWNHTDVVRELEEINITSVYHHIMKEEQGQESCLTFYMRRKPDSPYHIDYFFVSRSLLGKVTQLEIGKHEDWLKHSDHVPLIVDIEQCRSLDRDLSLT